MFRSLLQSRAVNLQSTRVTQQIRQQASQSMLRPLHSLQSKSFFSLAQTRVLTPNFIANSNCRSFATKVEQTKSQKEQIKEVLEILESEDVSKVRNLAIIAHVDHGKTTLVDCLLKQTGIDFGSERAMDSNEQEQERGITIMSKSTSVIHGDHKLNIVDTPGHQDFGGEVERIMTMVDGVCLVVCATEGPMPQTKFVLKKALESGLKPIVVINKVDRPSSRVSEVENEIFDLFCNLDANDDQLEYQVVYAAAKNGWAISDLESDRVGVKDLLDTIVNEIPAPNLDPKGDLKMLVTQTESNQYFGKMLIGRISSGSIQVGDKISAVGQDGTIETQAKVMRIQKRFGMVDMELKHAFAGDIVSIAGVPMATVGHTLNGTGTTHVIPSIPIDPPMLSFTVTYNASPLKGLDGDKLTIAQIRERLIKESEDDVSLQVKRDATTSEYVVISGRGDLHLGVLLEKMRREGFEMAITPPEVVCKTNEQGEKLEPFEEVIIELDLNYVADIVENVNNRKGILLNAEEMADGKQMLTFKIPSRGLLGFRTYVTTLTRGTGQLQSQFMEYDSWAGDVKKSSKGAIISTAKGTTTAYSLRDVQGKGGLYVGINMPVYEGMVIGEHVLENDIDMNPTKAKQLTNIRTKGTEDAIILTPPKLLSLEDAVGLIRDDELVEVTPKWIRLRKRILEQSARNRALRSAKNAKANR